MKRIMATVTSALMLIMAAGVFGGCDDKEEEMRVMNVSCNPSVEFVLDANDKVVSVNALNEEGNVILSGEVFVNLSAEEAAKLFVECSKDMGFLVEANASVAGGEISISFSGDDATALYNSVKGKINEYLTAENITVSIEQAEAITTAQLQALVAECAPYVDKAELQALRQMELVEMLYESRKETVDFHSQELKKAYYEAKAVAMQKAELDTLKSKVGSLTATLLEGTYKTYTDAVSSIENARKELLVDADSDYQVALARFREAKVEYLTYRAELAETIEITTAMREALARLETALTGAENALLSAGQMANNTLDAIKTQVTTAYNGVVAMIESFSVKANDHLEEISEKQKEAQTAFFTSFETNYAAAITAAKTDWQTMKTTLENRTSEQA